MFQVLFFEKEAQEQAELMISEGDNQLAKEIWNLPDQKVIKKFISATMPDIKFSKKHFISRIYPDYLNSFGLEPLPQVYIE